MKVVPFQASNQNLYKSSFPHFFLDGRVGADIEQDIQAIEEQFILFPYEYI
jgi:hypothetical protein